MKQPPNSVTYQSPKQPSCLYPPPYSQRHQLPLSCIIIFGILTHINFFTLVAQEVDNYLSPKNNVMDQRWSY